MARNHVSMYNELNLVCVACEGILCGERLDACTAIHNYLRPMEL